MLHYSLENWITLMGGFAIFIMGLRVFWLDSNNKMYRSFLAATFFLFMQNWLFFELDRTNDLAEAMAIRPWQESSWNFSVVSISLTMWFYAQQFTKREMHNWERNWLYAVLLTSPLIIFLEAFTSLGHGELVLNERAKWTVIITDPQFYDYLRALWCASAYSLSVYFTFLPAYYGKHTNNRWVRWSIFVVFGLIMLVTFVQNYVGTMFFGQAALLNESINVIVGAIFSGLMIINLQLYDLQSRYAVPNLMKTMTNWFILTDENLRIKQVNDAFLSMMGRTEKYWVDTRMDQIFGAQNEDWQDTKIHLRQFTEHEHISFDIKLFPKGKTVFLNFVITPIIQKNWKIKSTRQGYAFVGADLSEYKESEEQIRAYANDLETSNKALERFAFIASHDLKEPIRNIGNFAGLLRRRLPELVREEVKDYLDFIEQSVSGMNKLIEAVMTVSRLGQDEFSFLRVDSQKLLEQMVENVHSADKMQVELGRFPPLAGDEQLLGQLFQNLIENALKYNQSPTPMLRITPEPAKVDYCNIRIEDNGIGIPPEYRKEVFEMFKRLHTRAEFAGTGIGLAICRRIVELHEGDIWIENPQHFEQGTAFIVSLPLFTAQK